MNESATRVTSNDVARRAGVAQSTVSLVMSGKAAGRISAELQQRVRLAAAELDYRPSHSARALREGRTRALGLLVPDITNPFLGLVMHGAQERAWAGGHALVLMESGQGADRHRQAVDALRGGLVDGLLLFAVAPASKLGDLGPTVLIEVERRGFASVVLDSERGLLAAVRQLHAAGHTRIGYLGVGSGRWTFVRRQRHWAKAMASCGLGIDPRCCADCALTFDDAALTAARLLASPRRPTALVCADDLLAAGVYAAAADLAMQVPAQLSVVSFAGTVVGRALRPTLSTVAAPADELGATGVDLLLRAMNGEQLPARTVLPVSLQPGASVAAPAARRRAGAAHRGV